MEAQVRKKRKLAVPSIWRETALMHPSPASLENETEEQNAEDFGELPSDVQAAVMSLRNRMHGSASATQGRPPVVLKSHIYTILADRTAADRELDALRIQNKVRVYKLYTGADEHAVLLTEDLLALVEHLKLKRAHQQQHVHSCAASAAGQGFLTDPTAQAANLLTPQVLTLFMERIIPGCTTSSISKQQLMQLLSQRPPTQQQQQHQKRHQSQAAIGTPGASFVPGSGRASSSSMSSGPVARISSEEVISQLLSQELLVRDPLCDGVYTFTIPGAGAFMQDLTKGRKELTQLVSKKKYGEALESELLKSHKLRQSQLGMAFHIYDLVAKGVLVKEPTPAGSVLRVKKGTANLR